MTKGTQVRYVKDFGWFGTLVEDSWEDKDGNEYVVVKFNHDPDYVYIVDVDLLRDVSYLYKEAV